MNWHNTRARKHGYGDYHIAAWLHAGYFCRKEYKFARAASYSIIKTDTPSTFLLGRVTHPLRYALLERLAYI